MDAGQNDHDPLVLDEVEETIGKPLEQEPSCVAVENPRGKRSLRYSRNASTDSIEELVAETTALPLVPIAGLVEVGKCRLPKEDREQGSALETAANFFPGYAEGTTSLDVTVEVIKTRVQ